MHDRVPSPPEIDDGLLRPPPDPEPSLWDSPEIAVLSILEQTLETTVSVMCRTNPGILDHERPYWVKSLPSEAVADRVVNLSFSLMRSVRKYRTTLLVEQAHKTTQPDKASEDLDF